MRSTFTRTHAALACAMALGLFAANANAQRDIDERALLLDTRGAAVTNATGLCWHTGYGPAPLWTEGCHAERPVPVAQYIAPVAAPAAVPAPAPAPVIIAAAAPLPVFEKVAFEADVLFDSNKSALTSAGRSTLDAFIGKLSGLDAQSLMAIGHADRMGSEASNQVLSEERVNEVKSYLVAKGVAADRVQTRAWGETRPSTVSAECRDANNPKNVACMQPDRHVVIEVSGTRKVSQ